ncbi:hypothetical protein HNQ36_005115 [Afipia massiliensis]|uniref:Uncharacterized protein n=1 Tax=Afipia massiliensis TaxID=211460 RepID=A0A840N986_9BRAD|nr:hypothetical protein [Afipia massiliensis]
MPIDYPKQYFQPIFFSQRRFFICQVWYRRIVFED